MAEFRMTGGCQCGAVRYALHEPPFNATICYCRMCQKAFGSYLAPFAVVSDAAFEVTRGRISTFRSSVHIDRGFCERCGTPLTYRDVRGETTSFTLGSLDDPVAIRPETQIGVESRMPWFAEIGALPTSTTTEAMAGYEADLADVGRTNRQHPDRDTAVWRPEERNHG